ncbi:MAG: glycine dehydrogenase (aminomethyl-transferring) [Bdellovibrionales bacterium GWB1_52_6]|nr:MAG: glycine dehydrogenase (aminomethyl-transferring) [Bdellovibrionales bacterium GWB1_52_6]OFZ04396.1 MAG: glycine dehydrogenase (aminomethyl-transferring) [Bdellovibrionales bacterium GWA1_52_35]HCM40748.1 glycine dehydrogenase (aminomethyl-transferring) [Bdellovibrionales bacterium]
MNIKHMNNTNESLRYSDRFVNRHLGPSAKERSEMLQFLGFSSLDELAGATVPKQIRLKQGLRLPEALSEYEALAAVRKIADENQVFRSFIGMGYYNTVTPPVIQRNIFENPGWYTQYTPYQAEISQGRLEALLNFQTMVSDMTGFPVSNASLLDEGTAAAEAMNMCFGIKGRDESKSFFVSKDCFPQTIEVVRTRAKPFNIKIIVGDAETFDFSKPIFGALLQYPAADGTVRELKSFIDRVHAAEALVVIAADILSLAILTPPAELGADIAVGSTQRFGVPIGFGGPHAAYLAVKDEYKRLAPGRIVGLSKDADGKPAIRLALQTREQHIRRDKATSNICTAQVLLAIMASMYAVYHGPEGVRKIAERVHLLARVLKEGLKTLGYEMDETAFFDTLFIKADTKAQQALVQAATQAKINVRIIDSEHVGISCDEATSAQDLSDLLAIFAKAKGRTSDLKVNDLLASVSKKGSVIPASLTRKSAFLTHPVFNQYHSETDMLRYLHRLQTKDLSLVASMIPLGSCTMKLNAAAEMYPISWADFSRMHPFASPEQTRGYLKLFKQLEGMLAEITGFSAVSLQPNAGAQGEYAGLLVIKKYHETRNEAHRDICLIPKSAHGTNPASASLAGMKVVVVDCDSSGNIDVNDLKAKAMEHSKNLAAFMVTYPSTHGVFEEAILEICQIIHQHGGQVYMDGANMNAQVGLCRPADIGADVCHLNLHKTFAIPHGGGGPGVGPIGVKAHLAPFLPGHPVVATSGNQAIGPISAAPWGSASILPISWMYITMMGAEGLKQATEVAILNANYIAKKLAPHYPVLYTGKEGMIAHECIFDLRPIKDKTGIEAEDVTKRLMDYGFHAPTMSFPVPGTLMVEPTESEPKRELDRFCDAMIAIRKEIAEIESGKADRQNNLLKNAPHTAEQIARTEWTRPYTREQAAFPTRDTRESKFWPAVSRINNVLGDRQLICTCAPIESYQS